MIRLEGSVAGGTGQSFLCEAFALRLIRRKVRRLARCPGFTAADRDDLEQELMLKVWEARNRYDSRRSHPHAFVATVVERAAATLVRDRKAVKRGNHLVHCSFGTDAVCDSGQEHLAVADGDIASTPSRETQIDLAHDVAELISRLPRELREVAELLSSRSKRGIARQLGISRSALDRRLEQLRAHFVAGGVDGIS
jgi:RNA polymerase sigma factor (sigma-70 family)